jgi:hypothetical protein
VRSARYIIAVTTITLCYIQKPRPQWSNFATRGECQRAVNLLSILFCLPLFARPFGLGRRLIGSCSTSAKSSRTS